MIPAEVENLQSQLVEGHLAVEEFFAIILQSYELELCQESFTIHVSLSQILQNLNFFFFCFDIFVKYEFEGLCHRYI